MYCYDIVDNDVYGGLIMWYIVDNVYISIWFFVFWGVVYNFLLLCCGILD